MKRMAVILALCVLALAACGTGETVAELYTASGDGTNPDELTGTTRFKPDDDLNVVIRLNPHSKSLALRAVFVGPDGMQIGTDTLEADPTVGEALLGLDWEAQGAGNWPAGDWQVQVFVNEELHSTLDFTVEGGAG